MFLLTLSPGKRENGKCAVRLLHTRDPKPGIGGLIPGVHAATEVLCIVCVILAFVGFLFLLLKGVPIFSTMYATFKATNANKFKVQGSDVTKCDPCVRGMYAIFVFLFKVGFDYCCLLLIQRMGRILGSRRLQLCVVVFMIDVLLVAFGIQKLCNS